MRNQKGWTILEALIVLAMLGIAALMVYEKYIGDQHQDRNQVARTQAGYVQTVAESFARRNSGRYAPTVRSLFDPKVGFSNAGNDRIMEPTNGSKPWSVGYIRTPDGSTYRIYWIDAKGDTGGILTPDQPDTTLPKLNGGEG